MHTSNRKINQRSNPSTADCREQRQTGQKILMGCAEGYIKKWGRGLVRNGNGSSVKELRHIVGPRNRNRPDFRVTMSSGEDHITDP